VSNSLAKRTGVRGVAVAAAAALLVSGCSVGPNYKRPAVNTPTSYRGAAAPEIATTVDGTPLGAEKYTNVFTDPVLQGLIAEALKNNFDVRIAADRVLEEQAQVGITRAAQFPSVTAGGMYDAVSLPGGLLNGVNNGSGSSSSSSNKNGHTDIYTGGFTAAAAWNLDFWGLYRRQTEAARAELRATQWAQQTTYSTLVAQVATDYYQLRTLDDQLIITQETLQARKQSLDLTNKLEQGGGSSLADVRQAEELYYTAQAQIPDLQRQIEQQENNLAFLLGRNPGPIVRNATTNSDSIATAPHPVDVPVGLPSELLERRPDIRRAEELLVQANANIGVAKAQFFPQISLSATAGTASSQLKGLVDSKNFYYYALGNLTQTVFDAGKLKNNYRLAKAKDQELIDTYQQTIAGALRDVSNALIAYSKQRAYREQQEKLVAAAQDATRLARIRYEGGATSYLEVLTTDSSLYAAQLNLATAQQNEELSLVQLYNALGGGWEGQAGAAPTSKTTK
jgi:multidrug efflux system outer membrane protein